MIKIYDTVWRFTTKAQPYLTFFWGRGVTPGSSHGAMSGHRTHPTRKYKFTDDKKSTTVHAPSSAEAAVCETQRAVAERSRDRFMVGTATGAGRRPRLHCLMLIPRTAEDSNTPGSAATATQSAFGNGGATSMGQGG